MYFVFQANITSKNVLKQLIILNQLTQGVASITTSYNLFSGHKNVILDSPFHFKTVKTHITAPTVLYTIYLTRLTHTPVHPVGNLVLKTSDRQVYVQV